MRHPSTVTHHARRLPYHPWAKVTLPGDHRTTVHTWAGHRMDWLDVTATGATAAGTTTTGTVIRARAGARARATATDTAASVGSTATTAG